mmetsp:Transcript_4638/g.6102  ORF Transcript_4638/g.6102 Transcript_4638/m.6102 type:complete len:81 (-) Transcript_4638:152-394(-)
MISNQEPLPLLDFFAQFAVLVPGFSFCRLPSTPVFTLVIVVEVATSLERSIPRDLELLSYTSLPFQTMNYFFDHSEAEQN